jgi:hypothetical protein
MTGDEPLLHARSKPAQLAALATTINREHGLAYRAALDALEHAILCGEALIEARETVPDGRPDRHVP